MQDRPPRDWEKNPPTITSTSTSGYGRACNVHHEFLPFNVRSTNPLEIVQAATSLVDEMAPTKATFTSVEVADRTTIPSVVVAKYTKPMLLCGAHPLEDPPFNSTVRFANPHYCHLSTLSPEADPRMRTYWLWRYSEFGAHVDYETIAGHFGMTPESLAQWCSERDIPWQAWRAAGTRKMARTAHVIHSWGYTWKDVAFAFGMNHRTLRERVATESRGRGFSPPPDPTRPNVRERIEPIVSV